VLTGRFGPYVQLGEVDSAPDGKPKRASLFSSMSPATVTFEQALQLLSLPRVVGVDAEGQEITAQLGRYGPYLKRGTDSRSLESEDMLFTVTLEQALGIFAQPKRRGRATKPPLAELGEHPDSGAAVRVLDGRYGPYVTDGTTNATVPRGTDPTALTLDEAVALLRDRAERAPAKKAKKVGKKTAKKPAKKTVKKVGKKTAKKPAKKKTAAKKTAKESSATPSDDGSDTPAMKIGETGLDADAT
jgi:DNA topoisomerase-1